MFFPLKGHSQYNQLCSILKMKNLVITHNIIIFFNHDESPKEIVFKFIAYILTGAVPLNPNI